LKRREWDSNPLGILGDCIIYKLFFILYFSSALSPNSIYLARIKLIYHS
jgi:hypothetical protein